MDPLLWVPACSLILNNFINVNRSYAHINGRINSLGFVALQLMICNNPCKMLSNFLPSNATLPQKELKIRHGSHHGVGKTGGWEKEGSPAGWRLCRRASQHVVRGSAAGGTDTTRPRDNERDEGRKRKLTESKPDAGVYYNLKWKRLTATVLLKSATGSSHFSRA